MDVFSSINYKVINPKILKVPIIYSIPTFLYIYFTFKLTASRHITQYKFTNFFKILCKLLNAAAFIQIFLPKL